MTTKRSIRIEGSEELIRAFETLGRKGPGAALKGLAQVAVLILAEAKNNLKRGGQRATGKLFNSGRASRVRGEKAYEVSFGSTEKDIMYAYYVEFGRKPGKQPPVAFILEWIKKKQLADTFSIKTRRQTRRGKTFEDRAKSMAFAIAKSIGKKGTKAHPFLFPAFMKEQKRAEEFIAQEFEKVIKELEQ